MAKDKVRAPTYVVETPEGHQKFRAGLLNWFDKNQRKLPWRRAKPLPYQVWVSEIMLQQTRVAAVIDYYQKFLRRFPTVEKLASANEQQVLAAWSGLGYYRRARMMHQTARILVTQCKGKLPATSAQLRALPGIGRYTSAAIASIAFNESVAVVDGNVERVISRLTASSKKYKVDSWPVAQALLSSERPGDFNQAMMELGATVCLPRNPKCGQCPITAGCKTRGETRSSRATTRKSAALSYLLSLKGSNIALVQRETAAARMAGMWELPILNKEPRQKELLSLRHSITDTDYRVRVYAGENGSSPFTWIAISKLDETALTGLTRKILRRVGLLNIQTKTDSRP